MEDNELKEKEPKKEFSFSTIKNFDDHILQSIPNYDLLFFSIYNMFPYFKDESKVIYDIGCSTGKLLQYLRRAGNYKGKMVGLDMAANLLPAKREDENIHYIKYDLNKDYIFDNACLIFSVFTLQFLQKDARAKVIKNAYDGLCKGGAMIVAEKVFSETAIMQDIFTFAYYDFKRESFSADQILNKERDLRTILKPYTSFDNQKMLIDAGFSYVEKFYKFFNFEAYLCIK